MISCRPPKGGLVAIISYRGITKFCSSNSLTVAGFGEILIFLTLLCGTRINLFNKFRIVYVDLIRIDSNYRTFGGSVSFVALDDNLWKKKKRGVPYFACKSSSLKLSSPPRRTS